MNAEIEHKDPDRLTIEAAVNEKLIPELDDTNFMLLGKSSCQRGQLMLFAMALGWSRGLNIKLNKPQGGGFVRRESLDTQVPVMIDALHFAKLGYENPDDLRFIDDAYKLAEEYANAGFKFIEAELQSRTSSETYANELIADMDDMYQKWFS